MYDYAEINGGAAKVAIQSAIALSKYDFNVFFFAACGPVDEELQNSKVTVKCLWINDINHGKRLAAVKNGIWNHHVEKQFETFLRDFSPNETVVHVHGWTKALSSAVIKVSCQAGFKTLITLHDYFTICPNGGLYNYQKQHICTCKPMSADCIICNCDKRNYAQKVWRVERQLVQDKYVRNNPNIAYISISQSNNDIVQPYVRSKTFYRVNNPIQLANDLIEDCTKSNIFLFIGRLSEEKGIELFCLAIDEIKANYNIVGIVVGMGEQYEELRREFPFIRFEGWKSSEEVQKYINQARALVLPSKWYEGAPLTILEAMSAGLPCIISDCTSATEFIKDGINGFVFKTGNVQSLKDRMLYALEDKNLQFIQNIIKRTSYKDYANDAHATRLISVYKDWLVHE